MCPAMLANRDFWPGMNAKWTLSCWKAGFLWASCYCRSALATTQLLFDFLRSAHIPNLFYAIAHLATAHRWQWDCYTVDILTCPSRKRTGRMNDCCIPFLGAPAIAQVIVPDYIHLCLSSFNMPNSGLCGQSLSFDEQAGVPSSRRSHSPGPAGGNLWQSLTWPPLERAKFGPSVFAFYFVPTTSTQQQSNIFNSQFSLLINHKVSACPVSLLQS